MRTLLLGIDLGTSACKAAVLDTEHGRELGHGRAPTPWRRVDTGAEADPRALFAAACAAAQAALSAAPEGRVLAIGVTSMAEAGVLLDRSGRELHPAIAWHDSRGAGEARMLGDELGTDAFARHTGLPVSELCSLAKLRWLVDNRRLPRPPRRWCNVAEWVVRCLGGREVSELSLASRTGMLDLEAQQPYRDALRWAGAPENLLAELVWAGTPAGVVRSGILPGAAGATLTVAGMDHLCAGVGVGVLAPGEVLDSCGTAEALVRVLAPPLDADQVAAAVASGLTVGWHLAPGRQALLGALWSGLALQEVLDAHGLTLPVRGDSSADVWRQAVAKVARQVEAILKAMDALAGARRRLVLTGGWSHDPAVIEAKRRLGAERAAGAIEAGARGAALVGGIAAGVYDGVDQLP